MPDLNTESKPHHPPFPTSIVCPQRERIISYPEFKDYLRGRYITQIGKEVPEDLVLHRFSAVGALYWPNDEQVFFRDASVIMRGFSMLLDIGFPISPDFQIEFVNLKDGQDFLATDNPTDVAIFCHICDDPYYSGRREPLLYDLDAESGRQAYEKDLRKHNQVMQFHKENPSPWDIFHGTLSPHARLEDGWRNALVAHQVKIALNSNTSLQPQRLASITHPLILDEKTLSVPARMEKRIPSTGLDILGSLEYLRTILQYLDPQSGLTTLIGQKLQAVAPKPFRSSSAPAGTTL